MNNKFLLCLLIVCLTSDVVISKFGSRSSSSRSRSSGSHSSGRSSSHSSHKPSSSGHNYPSSSGLSGSGSVKHNYPSSSSGLSGSSWSGHSAFSSSRHSGSGSIKPSYPSSSSGLSGSSGSKPHYPSASSGFSGIGFNTPSQSSSSHFSGSGSLQPSYPSSSSGLSGSGRSKPFYPSSSSGLSGSDWGKPSPSISIGYTGSGGIKHDYPSLSSGLSGFGESKPHYPSDSSGLSGIGFGKPSQSSSSHFSGFGSLQPSYPSSSSGLSGLGGSKPFDQPSSGFSGVNWNKPSPALFPKFTESRPIKPDYSPSSGPFGFAWNKSYQPDSKKVSYPPSSGNSGNENHMYPKSSGNFNKPYDTPFQRSNTYHAPSGPGSHHYGYNGNTHVNYAIPPNYHMFPQYVYVSQYRNSGSRYGDILTGLALYNMGRSHSHDYHEYYFHDDYYRTRHVTQSGNGYTYRNSKRPKDEAICTLTIKEIDRQELLKIPCEIVSTFAEDGIISACWVAGAGIGLLPLFGWHAAVDSAPGCYFVEVMDYNYLLFLYFATIVTPSVLLAAFYAHIYRVVVKQMSAVVTVEGSHGRTAGGTMLRVLGAAQKREVKATQNLAIIVFFFIICWIPLYTINAVKAFIPELDIPNPLTYFSIIFSHLNSAINPLLYAYHLKDFRAALKGLICAIFGRGVPTPAGYRPPMPVRRPALERCNALRERPRVYVNSPVWQRQRAAEAAIKDERNKTLGVTTAVVADMEPFLDKTIADSSSGRHSPEGRDNSLYLIDSNQEKCQSPYKKVEEFIRRVRSVSSEHS